METSCRRIVRWLSSSARLLDKMRWAASCCLAAISQAEANPLLLATVDICFQREEKTDIPNFSTSPLDLQSLMMLRTWRSSSTSLSSTLASTSSDFLNFSISMSSSSCLFARPPLAALSRSKIFFFFCSPRTPLTASLFSAGSASIISSSWASSSSRATRHRCFFIKALETSDSLIPTLFSFLSSLFSSAFLVACWAVGCL
mmetsp:Transcript_18547/g.42317  ORF Transcript_18547/g.42317 Transcript_18547/m.42317 type:complete len:201 (-) Transcript_18547:2116-2718(-)